MQITAVLPHSVAKDVSAALLTGGRARRLGGIFKPGLPVGGRAIVDRQLAVIHAAGIERVVLIGRTGVQHQRLAQVSDAVREGGALAALYTALLVSPTPSVIVLAGDMPFVSVPLLRSLMDLQGVDAVIPQNDGRWHPLCAGYRRSAARHLKASLDRSTFRVSDAVRGLRVRSISISSLASDGGTDPLMNINTPSDHLDAERAWREPR